VVVYQLSSGGILQTFSSGLEKFGLLSISIRWLSAFAPLIQVKVKGRITVAVFSGERRTGDVGGAVTTWKTRITEQLAPNWLTAQTLQ
jgi:hypothetical protein